MQESAVVLGVLRERGRKGLPLTQLYRQMFNRDLYLLAYGNIYSNQGAMTPGVSAETADGMSEEKIDQIIEAMRHERYRFAPARRTYIPKKNGKLRPLGLPSWSDKLVGEVVRLLLEAYYERRVIRNSPARAFTDLHLIVSKVLILARRAKDNSSRSVERRCELYHFTDGGAVALLSYLRTGC